MTTLWCVGCGPSLRGADLGFLAGRHTIAINRAHEIVPSPEHVWFSDFRFWQQYHEDLLDRAGQVHTVMDAAGRHLFYPSNFRVWKNTGKVGLDTNEGIRTGNNGGHAALNLAYHLGATRIILLGYDLRLGPNGEGHFHEEHPWGAMKDRTLREKMLPLFRPIALELADRGVEVLNATPGSALVVFPKADLATVLREENTR